MTVLVAGAGCHGKRSSGDLQPAPTSHRDERSARGSSTAVIAAPATDPVGRTDHAAVLSISPDPEDAAALHDLIRAQGARCGLREVADGVFAYFECKPFEAIHGTRDVFAAGKMDLLKKGKLHVSRDRPIPRGDRTEVLPDNVDHRVDNIEGPIKSQGAVGACTAFSLSTVMDNAILRLRAAEQAEAPGADEPKDRGDDPGWAMSPMHIWAQYGFPSMKAAGEAMLHREVAPLSVWPYSPRQACELERGGSPLCAQAYHVRPGSAARDPALQRQLQNANRAAQYKVQQIDRISTKPVNPDAIAAILATGADVWIGINVDGRAWQHLKERDPVIPNWRRTEGGHAVALAGYRKAPSGERQFLVHNSWGGTWGDHGFGWVSEEMIARHVEFAYAVRVEDKLGRSPPETDDRCPESELIDADTGLCAPMCPGPRRRVNGQCQDGSAPTHPSNARREARTKRRTTLPVHAIRPA